MLYKYRLSLLLVAKVHFKISYKIYDHVYWRINIMFWFNLYKNPVNDLATLTGGPATRLGYLSVTSQSTDEKKTALIFYLSILNFKSNGPKCRICFTDIIVYKKYNFRNLTSVFQNSIISDSNIKLKGHFNKSLSLHRHQEILNSSTTLQKQTKDGAAADDRISNRWVWGWGKGGWEWGEGHQTTFHNDMFLL